MKKLICELKDVPLENRAAELAKYTDLKPTDHLNEAMLYQHKGDIIVYFDDSDGKLWIHAKPQEPQLLSLKARQKAKELSKKSVAILWVIFAAFWGGIAWVFNR